MENKYQNLTIVEKIDMVGKLVHAIKLTMKCLN